MQYAVQFILLEYSLYLVNLSSFFVVQNTIIYVNKVAITKDSAAEHIISEHEVSYA